MKLLTWNVWFGEHEFVSRVKALYAEIMRRRPDVIALQEVRPELRALLDELAGYELHGGDSMFGYDVLLMTRVPVARTDELWLPSQMGRRVIAVDLACGLSVATVHLESTAACTRERTRQLNLIGPWLAARGEHACLVGDMNFDIFDVDESDALDDSYVDVWPTLHTTPGYTVDAKVNTMRAEIRNKIQKRIDRVFLRGSRWRATSIELVGTKPIDAQGTFTSDHFGLAVELAEIT